VFTHLENIVSGIFGHGSNICSKYEGNVQTVSMRTTGQQNRNHVLYQ